MNPQVCVLTFDVNDSDALKISRGLDAPVFGTQDYESFSREHENLITINWGTYWNPELLNGLWLNFPGSVRNACRKDVAFARFDRYHVPHPRFTYSQKRAKEWNINWTVVGRDTLTGRRSQGMTCYARTEMQDDNKHLAYTLCEDVAREFRFHVFGNKTIHAMEKVKDEELFPKALKKHGNKVNQIRSSMYGWHYSSAGLARNPPSQGLVEVAIQAVAALGMDFGAVDMAEDHSGFPTVFEVNSAPDLLGKNGVAYLEEFRKFIADPYKQL